MGQVAYQHADSTYPALLGAPDVLSSPVVTSISPNVGPPGTGVTITGSDLGTGVDTGVDFGTLPCPRFDVTDNGTRITVYLPTGIGVGVVAVRVTTNLGTSPAVPSCRFSYGGTAPVAVTGIRPTTGRRNAQVTIGGENFGQDAEVYFGNNRAELQGITPPNRIVALAPKADDPVRPTPPP
nr:IPT/TIG domain-containing protein [Streptomyces sp. SID3343]